MRFSGVGTVHQNGVAKRGIKTVVNMACTMLLHAAIHGPDGFVSTQLWPMAMDYAAWLYNHIPKWILELRLLSCGQEWLNPQ